MDQYEDLKNFTEKTQLKSLRFVDFTKQNREVNHGQWSIVSQLADKSQSLHEPPVAVIPAKHRTTNLNVFQQNAVPTAAASHSAATPAHELLHTPQEHQLPTANSAAEENKSPLFQEMSQSHTRGISAQSTPAISQTSTSVFQELTKVSATSAPETIAAPESTIAHSTTSQYQTRGENTPVPLSGAVPTKPLGKSTLLQQWQSHDASLSIPEPFKQPTNDAQVSAFATVSSSPFSANATPREDAQTQATANPGIFSHLFVQPDNDIPQQGKETLLQPLLKRIATCR